MIKKSFIPKIVSSIFLCGLLTSCATVTNSSAVKKEQNIEMREDPIVEKVINLSYPVKGEETNILKPSVLAYMKAMYEQAKDIPNDYLLHDFYITGEDGANYGKVYENETDKVRVADYYNPSFNEGRSKKVTLVFESEGLAENATFRVKYGLQPDLSDAKEIETTDTYVTVENLLSDRTYYWQVISGDTASSIESFHTSEGFRMATANGIANIRDMGGRKVSGNKHIKQGLIFRGGEMVSETYTVDGSTHYGNLNEDNMRVMRDELQIKYEIDFRGDDESNNLVHSPLYDDTDYSDIDYYRIPNMAAYDYLIKKSALNSDWLGVKQMFLAFKNAQNKHVYFHCWGGADRTGTAGFLLGGLLGMSYTDLIIDYELTSFACNYRPHNINDGKKVYRFPSMIWAIKNAKNTQTGDYYYSADKPISQIIEEMLIDRAGLTAQDIADIRANLLED